LKHCIQFFVVFPWEVHKAPPDINLLSTFGERHTNMALKLLILFGRRSKIPKSGSLEACSRNLLPSLVSLVQHMSSCTPMRSRGLWWG
jgi:hypothetical protein